MYFFNQKNYSNLHIIIDFIHHWIRHFLLISDTVKAFRTFCLSITSEWRLLFIVLGDNFQGEVGGIDRLDINICIQTGFVVNSFSLCQSRSNNRSHQHKQWEGTYIWIGVVYFALNIPTCKTGVCDVHSLSLSGLTDLDLPYTARLE